MPETKKLNIYQKIQKARVDLQNKLNLNMICI